MATENEITIGEMPDIPGSMASLVEIEEGGQSGRLSLTEIQAIQNAAWARLTIEIDAPAGGAAVMGQIDIGQLVMILSLHSDNPARIRLYASVAERNADQSRDVTTDPPAGTGCTFEATTTSSLLAFNCAPIPIVQNNENPISTLVAYTLEPQSTNAVHMTLTYQVLQA